jgi:hypothetical protein
MSASVSAVPEDEIAQRLIQVLGEFETVANSVTPEEAERSLDETTLQVFWRDWPSISSWAGALWRVVNQNLAGPARPPQDPDLDETGSSG